MSNPNTESLYSRYPTGFAWPAKDDRRGRYIMCPNDSRQPMTLGVVNDFGDLVEIPCRTVFGLCPVPMVAA